MNFKIFFSNFDLFKSPILFYFDGKQKVSTALGIFLSFMIYGALIVSFFNSNMIQKKDPFLSSYTSLSEEFSIYLDNKNFAPVFVVRNGTDSLKFIDPAYLNITIYQVDVLNNAPKKINFKECAKEDFEKDFFQRIGLNFLEYYTYFCFNETVHISKFNVLYTHKQVVFNVGKCRNGTEIICKSDDDIKDYIATKTFILAYLVNNFEPEMNIHSPLIITLACYH